MLFGLVGVAIPVVIHLFNRKSAHSTDWGAMQFLTDSMASRTRRIQLEDALLMATRCLIFGMIALALARPFAPPGSTIPYAVVLPALLIGISLFAVASALWQNRKLRAWLLFASAAIFLLTGVAIFYENYLNLRRLSGAGEQDIALIIDASTSMSARPDAAQQSNFERAIEEARDIILKSGSHSAFTIIAAGPSPLVRNPIPWTDRSELNDLLDTLAPSDGQMRGYQAVLAASHALAAGDHEGKQIIVITDGQDIGWQADDAASWEFLASELPDRPHKPQLLIRQLPLPNPFRNLAVTGIEFSRDVIGVDREVQIQVTLENTGTEAVTPNSVQLRIGNQTLTDTSLGQFPPGLENTLTFNHHFHQSGAQVLTAVADLSDDLAMDNSFSTAIPIIDRLGVLIIDGNPAPRFFARASAFVELALAPGMLAQQAHLIEPTIVPAPQIVSIQSFEGYQAIILADVPRLPAPIARELSDYVKRGGGLLIAPGRRAIPAFYNSWEPSPAQLGKFTIVDQDQLAPAPSLATFTHPAVRKVGTPDQSDFASLKMAAYWQLDTTDRGTAVAAKLDTGQAFVAVRTLGAGKVIMTNCSLDTQSSNIASRESFLPFVHELVYHIADPNALQLNLNPTADLSLPIDPSATSTKDQSVDTYTVTDPRGQLRQAEILSTPQGTIARISGGTMAGLYEIEIPDVAREQFATVLTSAGTLPFTVIRPAEESRLEPLTRAEIAFMSRYFEVLQPASTKDVHTILAGRSYGRELWKHLALGVLFLLIVEVALARWIATKRKTGSQEVIDFETRRGPKKQFQEQLKKIKA